jgi:hypothetical protein
MDLSEIQKALTIRFADDYSKISRIAHFIGMMKTGIDGLSALGVVINLNVDGLEMTGVIDNNPDPEPPTNSLASAIAFMQSAKAAE